MKEIEKKIKGDFKDDERVGTFAYLTKGGKVISKNY